MRGLFYRSVIFLTFLGLFANPSYGQDNLILTYNGADGVPEILNVCGDADTVQVVVRVNGPSLNIRSNLKATANLFRGVRLMNFLSSASTPGVTLDNSNPNRPVFSLPDMSPSGVSEVFLTFIVEANCSYVDTLLSNPAMIVQDRWVLNYTFSSGSLQETELTAEYRDAFLATQLNASISTSGGPLRTNDVRQRSILLTNSALGGRTDSVIYQFRQGPAVWVRSLTANGLPVTFTKSLLPGGDTLFTVVLTAPVFQLNQKGSLPGNNDVFMDPDENVRIVANIQLLDCTRSNTSVHEFQWGCYGRYCQNLVLNDQVVIGQGAPSVTFSFTGSVPTQRAGYCKNGQAVVTINNNGVEPDPGFGTMQNVRGEVHFPNHTLVDSGFQITSIRVGGVTLPLVGSAFNLGTNALFTSDPDGAGGLADTDGDGFFDDLPIGQSLEIIVNYSFQCPNNSSTDSCANQFATSFSTWVRYNNACGENLIQEHLQFINLYHLRTKVENLAPNDVWRGTGTVFQVIHRQTRSVSQFDRSGSADRIEVRVKIPTGVIPVVAQTTMTRNNTPLLLDTWTTVADTLVLRYRTSTFLNGDYEVKLAFMADCSALLGGTSFPFEFIYHASPCNCRHTWYCGNLPGPSIHNSSPPCPVELCAEGLQTLSVLAERTTFGYSDSTLNTPINPAVANKAVALSCDTVRFSLVNLVGQTVVNDSIGMALTWTNPDGTATDVSLFRFGRGVVTIKRGASAQSFNIQPSWVNVPNTVTNNKVMRVDLHQVLTAPGAMFPTLQPNDSIFIDLWCQINPDGPFRSEFTKIPNLRSYAYAIVNGVEKYCDNFGADMTIARMRSSFVFPSSLDMPFACEVKDLEYQVVTINNDYNDYFTGEYRPSIRVDSILFDFDPGILDASSILDCYARIPGHPIHGYSWFRVPNWSITPDGKYKAVFDTLGLVSLINRTDASPFSFKVRTQANCQSPTGSQNTDNYFPLFVNVHYTDRVYTANMPGSTCFASRRDTADTGIRYDSPPSIALTPITLTSLLTPTDSVKWQVRVCNTSALSDANLTWLSLEPNSDKIQICNVFDLTAGLDIPLKNSAGKWFGETVGMKSNNGVNVINDVCHTFLINAVIDTCSKVSMQLKAGWDCAPHASNWTPDSADACDVEQLLLEAEIARARLEAIATQNPTVPQLCDTTTITIRLRNTDLGNAKNVQTRFWIPLQGMELIPGSFQLAWPANAAFRGISDPSFVGPVVQGKQYQYNDLADFHTFLNTYGLPGFNPVSPNDSNEMVIRFKFTTNCDYKSGSIIYYDFIGNNFCGDPTNIETGETLPIEIKDATPPFNVLRFTNLISNSGLLAGGRDTITAGVVNLTNVATTKDEYLQVQLPVGVTYQPNSTVRVSPKGWIPGEPAIKNVGGIQFLSWNLPIGLPQFDTATLRFEVNTPVLDCNIDSLPIIVNSMFRMPIQCFSQNISCELDIITNINANEISYVHVHHNFTEQALLDYTATCGRGGNWRVSGRHVFKTALPRANPVTVVWFADTNNNQVSDPGETLLLFSQIPANTSQNPADTVDFEFLVSPADFCSIYAVVDTAGISACTSLPFTISMPDLKGAGPDTSLCAVPANGIALTVGNECLNPSDHVKNWTAIAPAQNSWISDRTIATPVISLPYLNKATPDTFYFELRTNLACGALQTDTVQIITGYLPTLAHTPVPPMVCGGNTLSITATGAQEYLWVDVNMADTVGRTAVLNWIPGASTLLRVFGFHSASPECVAALDIPVTVEPGLAVVNGPTSACRGETVTLTAGPAATIEWLDINNVLISNDPSITVTPYRSMTYKLVAYSMSGCTDTAIHTVTVLNTLSLAQALPDTNNCATNSVALSLVASDQIAAFTVTGTGAVTNTDIVGNQFNFNAQYSGPSQQIIISLQSTDGCWTRDTMTMDACRLGLGAIDTIRITVQAGDQDTVCFQLPGGIASITNYCTPNGNAIITLSQDSCIYVYGNWIGMDTACIAYCDPFNVCDTTVVIINVVPSVRLQVDTLCIGEQVNHCFTLPQLGLQNNLATWRWSDRQGSANTHFAFSPATGCITYTALKPGDAKATLEVCDNAGRCDSVRVFVHVDPCSLLTGSSYCDSVQIGERISYCPDTTQLPGRITSISNACPSLGTGNAEIYLNPQTFCMEYTGIAPGRDTACIIVCDEFGLCDTTYLCLTVVDGCLPPLPVDDTDTTRISQPRVIQVTLNDQVIGGIDSITIVSQPLYGTAIVNLDNTITYIAGDDYCARDDQFTYKVCTPCGCRTAAVNVFIKCDDIRIFNAVSGNKDGKNDVFYIANIEDYPDNELEIYNRWGELVYDTKGYKNTWNGTFQNNKELPDGTYYYLLKLNDEEGRIFSGFLELYR